MSALSYRGERFHLICGRREGSSWVCNQPKGHDGDHAMIVNALYVETERGVFARAGEGREDRTWGDIDHDLSTVEYEGEGQASKNVGLLLAVTLLRQHENKIGKDAALWSWDLRQEFRRSLALVLDTLEGQA